MSSIPEFAILYGEASTGKRKMWSVAVKATPEGHGIIVTTHGYEDGKKVVNERLLDKGKNIGRSNETTPLAQAVSEAKALWKKKCDAGYTVTTAVTTAVAPGAAADDDDNASVSSTEATTGAAAVPLPMLAHDYNKRGKSIVFPCFIQPKLDGVRCVATATGLFSRNGKAFPHLDHIKAEVNALAPGTILDGELYSDTLTFQEVVGLVKKQKLTAADAVKIAKIHLAVYDIIAADVGNAERNEQLVGILAGRSHLRPVETLECLRKEDIPAQHAKWVAAGYEGLMLRNKTAKYRVGVRSVDLQKYKEFEDAEYKVVGFKEGDGLEKGCVVWLCETATAKATAKGSTQQFAVRPRGTHEERQKLFLEGTKYVGKQLCVRYQELTTDGIPRFPVGISFRDYE
jgi:ATP-dependent DNA ligase